MPTAPTIFSGSAHFCGRISAKSCCSWPCSRFAAYIAAPLTASSKLSRKLNEPSVFRKKRHFLKRNVFCERLDPPGVLHVIDHEIVAMATSLPNFGLLARLCSLQSRGTRSPRNRRLPLCDELAFAECRKSTSQVSILTMRSLSRPPAPHRGSGERFEAPPSWILVT